MSQELLSLHLILAKRLRNNELPFSNWQKNNILEQILRGIQFCLHVCLCICMFLVMEEVRKRCPEPWNWGSRWLCATMWVLSSLQNLWGLQRLQAPTRLTILQAAAFRRLCLLPKILLVRKGRLGFASTCVCIEGGGGTRGLSPMAGA